LQAGSEIEESYIVARGIWDVTFTSTLKMEVTLSSEELVDFDVYVIS
jgi:hypothetical protein